MMTFSTRACFVASKGLDQKAFASVKDIWFLLADCLCSRTVSPWMSVLEASI